MTNKTTTRKTSAAYAGAILMKCGFKLAGRSKSPNGSAYSVWRNPTGKTMWLGGYYLESEDDVVAFPYAEHSAAEIEMYINAVC